MMVRALYRLFMATVIALVLDGLTKARAEQALVLYQPIQVVDEAFRLTLNYNTGVAFGLFDNGSALLSIISGAIIIGLILWLVQTVRVSRLSVEGALPIGLILGGALGNFVDRLPDGRVTDFLDVGLGAARWPTFNLADTFITLGAVLLVLTTLGEKRSMEAHHEA